MFWASVPYKKEHVRETARTVGGEYVQRRISARISMGRLVNEARAIKGVVDRAGPPSGLGFLVERCAGMLVDALDAFVTRKCGQAEISWLTM